MNEKETEALVAENEKLLLTAQVLPDMMESVRVSMSVGCRPMRAACLVGGNFGKRLRYRQRRDQNGRGQDEEPGDTDPGAGERAQGVEGFTP
jgi:hypothetical protein